MAEDMLLSRVIEIFMRTQSGLKTSFRSVTVECGSWNSAYQYVMGENGDAKEVNMFSVSLKDMENVKCDQDGKGRVVIHIGSGILKEGKCQS